MTLENFLIKASQILVISICAGKWVLLIKRSGILISLRNISVWFQRLAVVARRKAIKRKVAHTVSLANAN